jgi:LPPG:FO 2-phospho-L-lactate transferase
VRVAALAGGVGGAKLMVGLQRAVAAEDLTAIVNTGDDATVYGVAVSPDVDIITYWLAGIADRAQGWGILGDTFTVVEALAGLGAESWFRLGDRDFGTCLYRTQRLEQGAPPSVVADEIRRALGVRVRVLPMTDDRVRTIVECADGRSLEFQEYFVRERTQPEVTGLVFEGLDEARPAPGVLDALQRADRVVLCPSNPHLSIAPILALPGIRELLADHPCVMAVSPIVGGRALKGPADRLLESLGGQSDASGVAALYAGFCDFFVVDTRDGAEIAKVERHGMKAVALDTIMTDEDASARLAVQLLHLTG